MTYPTQQIIFFQPKAHVQGEGGGRRIGKNKGGKEEKKEEKRERERKEIEETGGEKIINNPDQDLNPGVSA